MCVLIVLRRQRVKNKACSALLRKREKESIIKLFHREEFGRAC